MMLWRTSCILVLSFVSLVSLVYADDISEDKTPKEQTQSILPTTLPVFLETFNEGKEYFQDGAWIKSENEKYAGQTIGVKNIFPSLDVPDAGSALVLETSYKHYGIVHPLSETFTLGETEEKRYAVFQYEVALTDGLECGGAYLKLLNAKENENKWTEFDDQTGYSVMFGPDKCGFTSKVHLIIRHFDEKKQVYEEKALKAPPSIKNDKLSHLYTLVLDRKENKYELFIDQETAKSGNLFTDFEPPFQPPQTIDDPNDKKPADWVDEQQIADPDAEKPEDWDESAPQYIIDEDATKPEDWYDNESETIPDPKAVKPEDWDDEDDGEWESPMMPNPKCTEGAGCGEWKQPNKANPAYKGKWSAPMIPNPAYKGEWAPQKIDNPDYYQVMNPSDISPINAIGLEVWTTSNGIAFDNVWLGHNVQEAQAFGEKTWKVKFEAQKAQSENESNEENEKLRELTLQKGTWYEVLKLYGQEMYAKFAGNRMYGYGGLITAIVIILTMLSFRQKDPTISSEETDAEQNPDEPEETEETEETEESEETEETNESSKLLEKTNDGNDNNKKKVGAPSPDKEEVEAEEDVKSFRSRKKAPKAD